MAFASVPALQSTNCRRFDIGLCNNLPHLGENRFAVGANSRITLEILCLQGSSFYWHFIFAHRTCAPFYRPPIRISSSFTWSGLFPNCHGEA
jgi:hypothetical protein